MASFFVVKLLLKPPLFFSSTVPLYIFLFFLSCREDIAVETPAPALGEPMDLMTALQLVLKKSAAHDGLAKGLREAAKSIEKHAAQLCILAEDCDQPDYVKLVKALCADHNVHLVTVPSAKTLGEWAGLCKIDSEGKARKVVGCSCVVIKDYGEESEGLNIVQEYVKSH
ncbi:40S ribosomal protein S12-like [Ananas comosus]|uniref:40S ribosomal protein S12 n=1 Tax=Ananas comosus TaxID=4615 RepID=A0A6P5EFW9_ANACO|nr:40S ribosomal protein S12-like [Ananas comosus]